MIAGSGYKLYWAPQNAFVRKEESAMNISDADNPTVEVRTRPTSSESEGESESESDSGGCIHVRDRGVMKKFIDTLQRSVSI